MKCYLCKNEEFDIVLCKNPIPIWAGVNVVDDNLYQDTGKYECELLQCRNCGHVQQRKNDKLNYALEKIYYSTGAQVSIPTGIGVFGKRKADLIIECFNLKNKRSILEIGCANGVLLRRLREKGMRRLVGIDPSLAGNSNEDGVRLIKSWVGPKLKIREKFDLIFAIGVFEHIEDIVGVLSFCKTHLNADGDLFFLVPRCEVELLNGDPILFLHEHIHYYTEDSIRYLLAWSGFRPQNILAQGDAFYVTANHTKEKVIPNSAKPIISYADYLQKLNVNLKRLNQLIRGHRKIGFHGVSNSLSNILGWLEVGKDYILLDNDELKQGKKYFGKIIMDPNTIVSHNVDLLIVLPVAYFNEIKEGYQGKYVGKIVNIFGELSRILN